MFQDKYTSISVKRTIYNNFTIDFNSSTKQFQVDCFMVPIPFESSLPHKQIEKLFWTPLVHIYLYITLVY